MDRRPQSRAPDTRHHDVASDGGARSWAIIASLIQTAKLNQVEPFAYLRDVLQQLVAGHTVNRLDELLPWNWKNAPAAIAA